MPESDSVVVPGTLRGYRAWVPRIGPHPGVVELAPVNSFMGKLPGVWNGLTCVAECKNLYRTGRARGWLGSLLTPHFASSPMLECTCGIYARYKTIEAPEQHLKIVGSIRASGRVILHQRGFRAEFATVEAIAVGNVEIAYTGDNGSISVNVYGEANYLLDKASKTVKNFAVFYNIPYFRNLEELQQEFPPQDVSELISQDRGRTAEELKNYYVEAAPNADIDVGSVSQIRVTPIKGDSNETTSGGGHTRQPNPFKNAY